MSRPVEAGGEGASLLPTPGVHEPYYTARPGGRLMHPDLANLLGALRDQPDDELAYLALADWCLEQPDEATQARGEHVRLSLEFSKMPRPMYGPGYQGKIAAWSATYKKISSLEKRH